MPLRWFALLLLCLTTAVRAAAPAALPPVASKPASFTVDIRPLLEQSCLQCHAKGKAKGGFSIETRESFLKGGDSGAAAVAGKSADSLVVKLVAGLDPDSVMPKKGSRWTAAQVSLLRAWIDQGMTWDDGVTFAKPPAANLAPRVVKLPDGPEAHPIDRLLAAERGRPRPLEDSGRPAALRVVDDATFARRAWLDCVGLLPPSKDLQAFLDDHSPDKREKLVRKLLADPYGYADHWLTFWNDLLRNDYKGTGFIDGGRKQITGWLYSALLANMPYDQFVRELVDPNPDSDGFTKGIVWRGTVPASMTPPMQAAQCVSQVFFGVNLKCASCHDSFVSDWTLADAYGLAAIFSDKPVEMVLCDKATGKLAVARFLYPQIGKIDPSADQESRQKRFAELITSQPNGRLAKNIVNRLWAKLIGRGLVEPLDDMEKPAWSPDLLDWLAQDLVEHKYDLKHTIALIMTSQAYQLPVVDTPAEGDKSAYVFRGPYARRLGAEQFTDAVNTLTGEWPRTPTSIEIDFTARGKLTVAPVPSPARSVAHHSDAEINEADAGNSKADLPIGMASYGVAWIWTDEPVTQGVVRSAQQLAKTKHDAAVKAAGQLIKPFHAANVAAVSSELGKLKAAAEESRKTAVESDRIQHSPERQAMIAGGSQNFEKELLGLTRHKVVFRKHFALDAVSAEAYATVAASQKAELFVNGKPASVIVNDLGRARSAVYDLKPLLKKGQNLVVLLIDSHTERPNLQPTDREKMPAVFNHLNERSGVAFYAMMRMGGGRIVEWASDTTWTGRRSPGPGAQTEKFDDKGWPAAVKPAAGIAPADEGPAIDDLGQMPPKQIGNELGHKLPGLIALTHRIGQMRTALVASDPLQLALGRPNREMVTSIRQDAATTIQALELTNGNTLDGKLKRNAPKLAAEAAKDPAAWVESIYRQTLCRLPNDAERKLAAEALGEKPTPEAVADFLWALLMQPEFQYIH